MVKGFSVCIALLLCLKAWAQPKCPSGQTGPKCADGSALKAGRPPCSSGKPQCCTGNTCSDAPGPDGGQSGGGQPGGGQPGGGKPGGGGGACVNPTCASPPCASKLGAVGCTTVSGTEAYNHELVKKGGTIASNSHIFGPFEAGFTSKQKSIIEGWGCSDASKVYDPTGGLDVGVAELKVAYLCKIELPRVVGDNYYGIIGPCGGHTNDYHFHRSFNCLYKETGAHSTAIGDVAQWKLYGKWEDFVGKKLPLLDACGGHFGPTPDSSGASVYHYHVQARKPFAVGCHGPTADNKLVSVAKCRSLYTECEASPEELTLSDTKKISYRRYCPCYDADEMNAGTIKELPALGTTDISVACSGGWCGSKENFHVKGGTGGKTPSKTLSTVMTLVGLDFDKVNNNATVKATVMTNIKEAYLANMPGYTKDDLSVELSKGSVKATVTIKPKAGSDTSTLKSLMTEQKVATEAAVLTKVKAMPASTLSSILESGKKASDLTATSSAAVEMTESTTGGSATTGSSATTGDSATQTSDAPVSGMLIPALLIMSGAHVLW